MLPCQEVDPDVFHGVADSAAGAPRLPWERKALTVCARCSVRSRCLDEALRYPVADQHGVVGGMTASERRDLLRRPRPAREGAAA